MAQKTQTDTMAKGNTRTLARKRRWALTLNNYTEDELKGLVNILDTKNHKYLIGREIGEEKETPHLQIYIETKNPTKWSTVKNWNNRLHIEPCKGDRIANLKYCSKENNFLTNFERSAFLTREQMILEDEYADIEWKRWQLDIINLIHEPPHKRKIYWFWENDGNVGKSFLLKFIYCIKKDKVIIGNGKMNDVFNQICQHITSGKEPKIILIDVPRDYATDYFNYGGLENIKNGFFYSGKYEGGQCVFKIPHIIVMCNEEPNYQKFSSDRYNVVEIE